MASTICEALDRGNFVSLSAAPPALLAACQNPFRTGDGVLDSVVGRCRLTRGLHPFTLELKLSESRTDS